MAKPPPGAARECQELDLAQAATTLVDECRMVLPGIQAIFGFQLIAVFNERFAKELGPGEQLLHLAAMCLVALAAGLVMTPAAIHRYRGARTVAASFIGVSTALLMAAMPVLAVGLSLSVYLIARLIAGQGAGAPVAGGLLAAMLFLWILFPRLEAVHARISALVMK